LQSGGESAGDRRLRGIWQEEKQVAIWRVDADDKAYA
jgi:hypothetical protein